MKYNFVRFKEIDSTNNEAKRYVSEGGVLPALLLAERQTEGRGRMGRSFYSSDNKGVYITVVMKAEAGDEAFLRATAVSAVCAVESIKELFGISTEIKWVNDIYYQSKKVAGILAESFVVDGERYVAVGFGINLYTQIPESLRDIAISLFPEYPDSYTLNMQRDALANRIAEKLLSVIEKNSFADYMAKYRSLSCVIGRKILFSENGNDYIASALDINDEGALIVELSDGSVKNLSTGEISLKTV
jgi:BirA family biotin operon repressor/biotin-[acetyl-CoA-carboxylase] ligase